MLQISCLINFQISISPLNYKSCHSLDNLHIKVLKANHMSFVIDLVLKEYHVNEQIMIFDLPFIDQLLY